MDRSRRPRAAGSGASLRSLPVEITSNIMARIMVNCTHDDLHDLYMMARASKWLYQTFMGNRSYLLTVLGRESLHHFDLAFAAVRATRLVEEALRSDQLVAAQDIILSTRQIRSGSADAAPPTFAEFSDMILLDKFTDVARIGILDPRHGLLRRVLGSEPLQPIAIEAWRRRFHVSMYRLIIAGAALSGAYLEPFLQTRIPQPRDFLARIYHSTLMFVDSGSSGELDVYEPSNEDIEYFCRFPLYRCRDGPAGHMGQGISEIFAPVLDWLVEDMKYEEMEAERESLSQETVFSRAPWLLYEPAKAKEVPEWQKKGDLREIDAVPQWPVHLQVHQMVRLERELASSVQNDRWGRALFVPELDEGMEEIVAFRRADGGQIRRYQTRKPKCRPLSLGTSDIAAARVVRYGMFVPEVILAHKPTDRGPGSCKLHGRALLRCRIAYERERPQGWKPKPQPLVENRRTAISNNSTFGSLFGGTPGRMLRLERVFFNLFVFKETRLVPETRHPALMTHLLRRVPVPDDAGIDGRHRLTPLATRGWDDFWGDTLNVLTYPEILPYPLGYLEGPDQEGVFPRIVKHLNELGARTRAIGPWDVPGSYTIF